MAALLRLIFYCMLCKTFASYQLIFRHIYEYEYIFELVDARRVSVYQCCNNFQVFTSKDWPNLKLPTIT